MVKSSFDVSEEWAGVNEGSSEEDLVAGRMGNAAVGVSH